MIERSSLKLKANGRYDLMPKKVFIKSLAEKLGTTQVVAVQIIEAIEDVVIEGLNEYEKVKIGDLVAFTKKPIPARQYRLPGEETVNTCEAYEKIVAHMVETNKKLKQI